MTADMGQGVLLAGFSRGFFSEYSFLLFLNLVPAGVGGGGPQSRVQRSEVRGHVCTHTCSTCSLYAQKKEVLGHNKKNTPLLALNGDSIAYISSFLSEKTKLALI